MSVSHPESTVSRDVSHSGTRQNHQPVRLIDSLNFVTPSFYQRLNSYYPISENPTGLGIQAEGEAESPRHSRNNRSEDTDDDGDDPRIRRFSNTPYHRIQKPRRHHPHQHYGHRLLPQFAIPTRLWDFLKITRPLVRQQRLPAWVPILNFTNVGRVCLILSLALLPLGVFLLVNGLEASEIKVEYGGEECVDSKNYLRITKRTCLFCGGRIPMCQIKFVVPFNMKTPVFLYYELENFHQNHRRLIKSVDHHQLYGTIWDPDMVPIAPLASCSPLNTDENGKFYFPCGGLANAMFSDRFLLKTDADAEVPLILKGISHRSLKKKYKNPPNLTHANFQYKPAFIKNFVHPQEWSSELYNEWWKNGGQENEQFINWMQASPTSTFRKLYAVIQSVPACSPNVLCIGNYTMHIDYRFDVESFEGNKAFILASTSFFGAGNLARPAITLLVGVLYASVGLVFLKRGELSEPQQERATTVHQLHKRHHPNRHKHRNQPHHRHHNHHHHHKHKRRQSDPEHTNEEEESEEDEEHQEEVEQTVRTESPEETNQRGSTNLAVVGNEADESDSISSDNEDEDADEFYHAIPQLTTPLEEDEDERVVGETSSESSMVSATESLHERDSPPALTEVRRESSDENESRAPSGSSVEKNEESSSSSNEDRDEPKPDPE